MKTTKKNKKKIILSGITASGNMHIGNYIGAIDNALKLNKKGNKCLFFVADLHGITTRYNPMELSSIRKEILGTYLASGFEMGNTSFFLQSENYDHTYLAWLFDCITIIRMKSMIQYKEKVKKYGLEASMGLMNYPALMSADILLYNPSYIPVGADQKQDVEFTRQK